MVTRPTPPPSARPSSRRSRRSYPDGLSTQQIVELFAVEGERLSEATFRKYVQLGLLPRSVRVGRKGKHRGSQGRYPGERRAADRRRAPADGAGLHDSAHPARVHEPAQRYRRAGAAALAADGVTHASRVGARVIRCTTTCSRARSMTLAASGTALDRQVARDRTTAGHARAHGASRCVGRERVRAGRRKAIEGTEASMAEQDSTLENAARGQPARRRAPSLGLIGAGVRSGSDRACARRLG